MFLQKYLFCCNITIIKPRLWIIYFFIIFQQLLNICNNTCILVVFFLFIPQIIAVSFDNEFARSQGLPTALIEYGMMALIALSVVACLRVAGIVMVISLLSVPQMTANLFTRNFTQMAVLSIIIAIFCCLAGLLFSYYYNVPSGATIILFSIANYMLLRTIKAVSLGFSKRKMCS